LLLPPLPPPTPRTKTLLRTTEGGEES
jgi:hypothetical protein